MYYYFRIIFCFCLGVTLSFSQNTFLKGIVTNTEEEIIPFVNVVSKDGKTTFSNENGYYELEVGDRKKITLIFSHVSYKKLIIDIKIIPNQVNELHPVLNKNIEEIGEVILIANNSPKIAGVTVLNPSSVRKIPGANAGIENLLLSLPGVNSNNELSTQYSVRGGNYDENLIYVNGIEIFKPILIRSGQQEGLSFLNSDLVDKISFQPGGFEAKYGDKMSSVLDITYKSPQDSNGIFRANLLGGSFSYGFSSEHWSNLLGVRYRNNKLLVNNKEIETDYRPIFADFQSLTSFKKSKLKFDFFNVFSLNKYDYSPRVRQTNFGTISNPRSLLVLYEGRENDNYRAFMSSLRGTYNLSRNSKISVDLSINENDENEYYDIIAQYLLGSPNNQIGTSDLGSVDYAEGVGSQHTHGRSDIKIKVLRTKVSGKHKINTSEIDWGLELQSEKIYDRIVEWEKIDSSGFSIRPPSLNQSNNQPYNAFVGNLELFNNIRNSQNTVIKRFSAYVQHSKKFLLGQNIAWINSGVRFQNWNIKNIDDSGSLFFSPRIQLSFQPLKNPNVINKISVGKYTQAPFYKELRDNSGNINFKIKPQNSIHLVLNHDRNFSIWDRNFIFQTSGYLKYLWDINPYTIENVRVRYAANNNSVGWIYGLDFRLHGEFIQGTESWISLGLLKAIENQNNRGYIPRPTDQRFKFALLFQDYVPSIPNLKINLNLVYNSGLPGGSPSYVDVYNYQNRLKDYKRADVSFLYVFKSLKNEKNFLKLIKEMEIGVEIYNLFNAQNSITNTWIRDAYTKRQFAVPNYMMSRVFNLEFDIKF